MSAVASSASWTVCLRWSHGLPRPIRSVSLPAHWPRAWPRSSVWPWRKCPPSRHRARGARLYAAECASCHGPAGRGDGPAAAALTPVPADLTDFRRLATTTPLDFYRRVTIGVAGTTMPAYESRLTAEERWAVASYASGLRL